MYGHGACSLLVFIKLLCHGIEIPTVEFAMCMLINAYDIPVCKTGQYGSNLLAAMLSSSLWFFDAREWDLGPATS